MELFDFMIPTDVIVLS